MQPLPTTEMHNEPYIRILTHSPARPKHLSKLDHQDNVPVRNNAAAARFTLVPTAVPRYIMSTSFVVRWRPRIHTLASIAVYLNEMPTLGTD